ncbi:MAG: hypothetical protein MUC43_00855 [Pirellula sp.]|nr:hypothetical protein [Pirellula sp.]
MSTIKWLIQEMVKAFSSPLSFLGSVLDALRGWRYSRKRVRILLGLLPVLLLAVVYAGYGFSLFERVDSRVQKYGFKSEAVCPSANLEEAAYSKLDFLKQNIGAEASKPLEISPIQMRYVKILNERILATEPDDNSAKYRLALSEAISGNVDECMTIMTDVASGKNGPFPAANSWIAAKMIDDFQKSNDNTMLPEIATQLKVASTWPGVRPQMLAFYARILASSGMVGDAITVAKDAVKRSRFYHLDLLQYYNAAGNADGVRTSGYEVEKIYGARINTALETKIDRLAVAEARFLMGKPDSAIEVLREGLAKESTTNKTELSRALSEYKLRQFDKSIQRLDDGTFIADVSYLDDAVDADPNNPKVSETVARMLPMKIRPSRKVIAILKQQIETGVTSGDAHRILAEGYYASGNTAEAIKSWESAISKSAIDASSRNNLALVLAREKPPQLERAFELIAEADRLSPNSAEVLDSYGQILAIANKPAEAIVKLEAAVRLDPNKKTTRKVLEQCYRQLNMIDLADAQAAAIKSIEDAGLPPKSTTTPD